MNCAWLVPAILFTYFMLTQGEMPVKRCVPHPFEILDPKWAQLNVHDLCYILTIFFRSISSIWKERDATAILPPIWNFGSEIGPRNCTQLLLNVLCSPHSRDIYYNVRQRSRKPSPNANFGPKIVTMDYVRFAFNCAAMFTFSSHPRPRRWYFWKIVSPRKRISWCYRVFQENFCVYFAH